MHAYPIKTDRFEINGDIYTFLDKFLPKTLDSDSIIAITSKIVSLSEGRVADKSEIDKDSLIALEADLLLKDDEKKYGIPITIAKNILIPAAGIDESNAWDKYYILYPRDPFISAFKIWQHLRARYNNIKIGVIITDSHVTPLRQGTIGIALSWCGFSPVKNYIGTPDLDNINLKVTKMNIADSLAATAVLCMGEGDEQTPISLITSPHKVKFCDSTPGQVEDLKMNLTEDLYSSFLQDSRWYKP